MVSEAPQHMSTTAAPTWEDWHRYLTEELKYPVAVEIPPGRYAAIYPLAYTVAIITGRQGDCFGFERRYCFHTGREALLALLVWQAQGFEGEPEGWHRDTLTGRRRPDGDPTKEHVAW